MKIAIDESKLRDLILSKINSFLEVLHNKFDEENKDVDKSFINFNAEEYLEITTVAEELWSEDLKKKAPEIIKSFNSIAESFNYELLTVEEVQSLLNLTEEEILNVKMDGKEGINIQKS